MLDFEVDIIEAVNNIAFSLVGAFVKCSDFEEGAFLFEDLCLEPALQVYGNNTRTHFTEAIFLEEAFYLKAIRHILSNF